MTTPKSIKTTNTYSLIDFVSVNFLFSVPNSLIFVFKSFSIFSYSDFCCGIELSLDSHSDKFVSRAS